LDCDALDISKSLVHKNHLGETEPRMGRDTWSERKHAVFQEEDLAFKQHHMLQASGPQVLELFKRRPRGRRTSNCSPPATCSATACHFRNANGSSRKWKRNPSGESGGAGTYTRPVLGTRISRALVSRHLLRSLPSSWAASQHHTEHRTWRITHPATLPLPLCPSPLEFSTLDSSTLVPLVFDCPCHTVPVDQSTRVTFSPAGPPDRADGQARTTRPNLTPGKLRVLTRHGAC